MIQTTLLAMPRRPSIAQSTTHQIGCTSAMNSISRPKATTKPSRARAANPESVSVIDGVRSHAPAAHRVGKRDCIGCAALMHGPRPADARRISLSRPPLCTIGGRFDGGAEGRRPAMANDRKGIGRLATLKGMARAAPEKPRPDAGMAQRHPLLILLAEDNVVNQKLAMRLLGQMGYRADLAGNGIEAIESIEHQPHNVVLMDEQMLEMDALEA